MLIGKLNAALILAAGGGEASPFDDRVDLAIFTLIVFLGLLFILGKYAWGPIIKALNEREESIAKDIDDAAAANEQAQAKLASYDAKIAGAQDEAAAIIAEAKNDAIAAKEKIMADAADEAQRTKDRAMADISAAKNAAVQELAQNSVDSAVDLAGSIVGRTLQKSDHSNLIDKSIEKFTSGSGA